MAEPPTQHGCAVLAGTRAVLIRGPSGSGKSRLALALLAAADRLRFTRLVADDRVHLEARHGRLLARPADTLKGLIEVHGLGIRRVAYEPVAVVGLVVDLVAPDAERLPDPAGREVMVAGVRLPRLAVAAGHDPLPAVLAGLATSGPGPP